MAGARRVAAAGPTQETVYMRVRVVCAFPAWPLALAFTLAMLLLW